MSREDVPEQLTIRETLSLLTVDGLRELLPLVRTGPVQGRKADLVDQLAGVLEKPQEIRSLYEGLDDLAKHAVQEATHDPRGVLHLSRFVAKYGTRPAFSTPGRSAYQSNPTRLRLLFPRGDVLPTDLRATLLPFVPKPAPLTVASGDELPAKVRPPQVKLGGYYGEPDEEEVELRVRPTARAALLDVKAVLRLIDAGEVKVGEKTHRPSQAALKAVAAVLSEGDFYTDADRYDEYDHDPASDLTMQAFAWPILLQAAGLAAGAKLQLTTTGRKATTWPAHEVISHVWNRWLKTTLLDEFNRVEVIKGQQSKGAMTAIAPRRTAVVAGLRACAPGKWVRIEDLFRQLKASGEPFAVARDDWRLYIGMQQYGSMGFDARHAWEGLQGRYTLAFLFEYVATLGLIDVAYISPIGARNDFRDRWGVDDITCLSRYDGLMYFRINPLGAWCLGLTDTYQPQAADVEKVLKVLPNLDVVAPDKPLPAADVLLLDRFAERQSNAVWRIDRGRILSAAEQGQSVGELREFLASRAVDQLPHTVEVFLDDVEAKASQLADLGTARLIACKDALVAQTLVSDRRLRALCHVAGEHHLVFQAADEAAVRRALKDLGYVLPPPR